MLQSLAVAPSQPPSQCTQALTQLKNVAGIHIGSKRKTEDGRSVYVIDLFFRANAQHTLLSPTSVPRSQLALHELTAGSKDVPLTQDLLGGRMPDKQVEKAFVEVFELRDKLMKSSFACRCAKRCRLCQEIFEYAVTTNKTPPAMLRAMLSNDHKMKTMEKLINAFVGIVVRSQILTTASTQCPSDDEIPVIIRDFLEL